MYTLFLYLLLTNMVPTPYYKDGYWYIHAGRFNRYHRLINDKAFHGFIREMCNGADEIILVYRDGNALLKWSEELGAYCYTAFLEIITSILLENDKFP